MYLSSYPCFSWVWITNFFLDPNWHYELWQKFPTADKVYWKIMCTFSAPPSQRNHSWAIYNINLGSGFSALVLVCRLVTIRIIEMAQCLLLWNNNIICMCTFKYNIYNPLSISVKKCRFLIFVYMFYLCTLHFIVLWKLARPVIFFSGQYSSWRISNHSNDLDTIFFEHRKC